MGEREELPQVHQAELTPELLSQLFAELRSSAQILEVRVQERRECLSGSAGYERLATLGQELATGTIRGLQIHYAHSGRAWIDTLLRRGPTIRLIRALALQQAPRGRPA